MKDDISKSGLIKSVQEAIETFEDIAEHLDGEKKEVVSDNAGILKECKKLVENMKVESEKQE